MVEGSESLNFNIPTHLPRVISEEEVKRTVYSINKDEAQRHDEFNSKSNSMLTP